MTYTFDEEIAKEYGVNEAIMITNFQFWIRKNKANDKNFYDGHYWTYNSKKAFSELFPFWTEKQIKTILEHLCTQGVLMKGNYNQSPFDRTLWYAFVDESKWLDQKRPIEQPEWSAPLDQMVQPIPDILPDIKTRINYVNTVKSDNPEVEKAKNIWNSVAQYWGLAEIRTLTEDRKKKLKLRLKEQNMTLEQFFDEIRIALEDSPFLRGKKWHEIPGHPNDSYWEDTDWRADFDFFLQPSSLQKAIEGKYADPTLRKERQRKQK